MKKILLTLGITLYIVTLSSQNVYDDLLFYYNFDGNTTDCWVNELDGINYRAVLTEDRFGNPAGAYYFDGETSYIEFPFDPKLKPELPVSFSAWVNFEEATNTSSQFFTSDYWPCYYSGVWSSISTSGNIAVSFGNGEFIGPYGRCTKVGETVIEPNTWYHIVCVVNSKYDMVIYINSIDDGGTYTGDGEGYLGYSGGGPGCLGRKSANYETPPLRFKGSLDEVGYWKRALTQADVDTLYSNELCISTDVGQTNHSSIDVYPNPSQNTVTIDIHNYNDYRSLKIEVYNSIGQKMYSKNVQSEKTILSKKYFSSKGLFFIKIFNPDNSFIETKEVIVN
jgi:hypothetical protein